MAEECGAGFAHTNHCSVSHISIFLPLVLNDQKDARYCTRRLLDSLIDSTYFIPLLNNCGGHTFLFKKPKENARYTDTLL